MKTQITNKSTSSPVFAELEEINILVIPPLQGGPYRSYILKLAGMTRTMHERKK